MDESIRAKVEAEVKSDRQEVSLRAKRSNLMVMTRPKRRDRHAPLAMTKRLVIARNEVTRQSRSCRVDLVSNDEIATPLMADRDDHERGVIARCEATRQSQEHEEHKKIATPSFVGSQ